MTKFIVYPRGAGGNWLSNLIYRLETNNTDIPKVEYMFDGEVRTQSIQFRHWYDINNGEIEWLVDPASNPIVFSTSYPFNLYLNVVVKIYLNPKFNTNILGDTEKEQFFKFMDLARYMLTDNTYKQCYYQNIQLDFKLIFVDPNLFVDNLFHILEQANIKHSANREYCLSSIANYRNTCADPCKYIGTDSIVWRAWLATLAEINEISLAGDVFEPETLAPFVKQLTEQNQSLYFNWI